MSLLKRLNVFKPVGSRVSLSMLCLAGGVMAGANLISVPSALAGCSSTGGAGVDWSGCRKRALIVNGSDFSEANFERTDFTGSDLRGTNLTGVNMTKATLNRTSIGGATLLNTTLSGVEGIRTGAQKASFQSVDLQKSMFFRAQFQSATLNDVNFSKAEFSRADFTGGRHRRHNHGILQHVASHIFGCTIQRRQFGRKLDVPYQFFRCGSDQHIRPYAAAVGQSLWRQRHASTGRIDRSGKLALRSR